MNFKRLIFTITLIFFFCGCIVNKNRSVNIIELEQQSDIVTKTRYKTNLWGYPPHYKFDTSGHLIASGIRYPTWDLIDYDISEGMVLDSLNFNYGKLQFIYDFNFISPDSILLAFNSAYENDCHDATLLIVDRDKKILDTVSFEGTPVKLRNSMPEVDKRCFVSYSEFPLIYKNGKIILPLLKWGKDEKTKCSREDSLIGIISYHPKSKFKKLPVYCTPPKEGFYWSYFYKLPKGVLAGDKMYIFFGNESLLFQYDFSTEKLKKKKIEFATIPAISPYKLDEAATQYDPYRSQFTELFYDSLHHNLIWTAKVKCDSSDSPVATQLRNYIYSFVMVDHNLNKLGEGILPEGYINTFIPYKDGFLLEKFFTKDDIVIYTYFTYSIKKGKVSELKDEINTRRAKMSKEAPKLPQNEAFAQYLKKVTGKDYDKHKKFIIIPESSCPQCMPVYANIIRTYQDKITQKKIAVVMINSNPEKVKEFIEQIENSENNVTWGAHNKKSVPIYSDTKQLYYNYFNLWVNLRYMEFDNLGEITYDKIINPADLQEFINKITE